jgi:hypothetical protein
MSANEENRQALEQQLLSVLGAIEEGGENMSEEVLAKLRRAVRKQRRSVPTQAVAAVAAPAAGGSPQPFGEVLTPDTLIGRSPSSFPVPDVQSLQSKDFHFGGYDGGTAVGFQCKITDAALEKLNAELGQLKEQAVEQDHKQDGVEGFLGGHRVVVFPTGAKEGLYYKYRIQWKGAVILIHHNPPAERQPVRCRYTTVSLMARGLRGIHSDVMEFLAALGFTEIEDTVSRADMQLTCAVPMSFFDGHGENDHIVTKLRKFKPVYVGTGTGKRCESLTFGEKGDKVQLCIYDKNAEIFSGKFGQKEVMVLERIGEEWRNSNESITRIEFRCGRKALKAFGVRSVSDLLRREKAVINKLTHDWFRILAKPKVRGTENKAEVHPLWERIRSLFFRYFPGDEVKEEDLKPLEPVAVDSKKLLSQAFGCLNKAVALKYGRQADVEQIEAIICSLFSRVAEKSKDKINAIVSRIETLSGIPIRGNDNTDYGMSNPTGHGHGWVRFVKPPEFHLRN